jgi:hypothetical protein
MILKFPTQYTEKKRIVSNPGSPIHITYGGSYDENGRVVLTEKGQENIYDYIQSFKESVDLNVLIARYNNGDASALSKAQGVYMDVTQFPTNYAEALNRMEILKDYFMSLPVETRSKFNHSFSEFLAASTSPDFLDMMGMKRPVAEDVQAPTDTKEVVTENE